MVEFGDVGPRHIGCSELANGGQYMPAQVISIRARRSRLEAHRDVLLVEALGEVGDGGYMAAALSVSCRVFAIPDARQNVDCARSGLLGRSDTVVTEAHAPTMVGEAVQNHISFRPARLHANAESGNLTVVDGIGFVSMLGGINEAFGDLGHDGPVF